MKAVVLKLNHGNHMGFNRKWEVLDKFEEDTDAHDFLVTYLTERDLVDEEGNIDPCYDGYYFVVITEEDESLFCGGHYGYAPKEVKEFFNWG